MKVLFLSDLHLGADYIADHRAHEGRVVDFLLKEGAGADAVYLLGDVLDYWYEYRNVVPRGFIRFFGALASLADSGTKIVWMTGNHDIWLFDYLRDEIGMEVVDSPYIIKDIAGKKFLLAHGDRIGRQSAGFRFICSFFRNRFCQKLYSAIHPRLTIAFAHRWSRASRGKGIEPNEEEHKQVLVTEGIEIVKNHPGLDYIVEGHHHIAFDTALPGSATRLIVLGDWIDKFTYAEFDGTECVLKKFM